MSGPRRDYEPGQGPMRGILLALAIGILLLVIVLVVAFSLPAAM